MILVSVFKFIAANFDHKLSSTVYLLVLFVASIATAIYSPLAGYLYVVEVGGDEFKDRYQNQRLLQSMHHFHRTNPHRAEGHG